MPEDETDPLMSWRGDLAAWAIPPEILAQAPEPPWQLPREMFARRADANLAAAPGVSQRLVAGVLPQEGWLLDVGAGAGAASLPLAGQLGRLLAVDERQDMLDDLVARADRLGLQTAIFHGRWPDIAGDVPAAHVAVCSHVLYNVADLGGFVGALDSHARRRVVVEMTARHPVSGLNPLWRRFHGLDRPERPTWVDAVRALRHLGLEPQIERWRRQPDETPPLDLAGLVALTRRRLCLPASRDGEVLEALVERGLDPAQPATWSLADPEVVTIWWDSA